MAHRFPFELIDPPKAAAAGEKLRVRLTAGQATLRGEVVLPSLLLIEIVAQAALGLFGKAPAEGAEPATVALAGLEGFELADGLALRPLRAGDELLIAATVAVRLGKLLKIEATVERDGEIVARGAWLLAS